MRAVIFCIALLAAFSAYAQDGRQPPQRGLIPDDVELQVTIATGEHKPNINHTETFPKSMTRQEKIDTCTTMANEFLSHKYPDSVDAKVLAATCIVPLNIKDDDT